jgi:hypothetical protein
MDNTVTMIAIGYRGYCILVRSLLVIMVTAFWYDHYWLSWLLHFGTIAIGCHSYCIFVVTPVLLSPYNIISLVIVMTVHMQ